MFEFIDKAGKFGPLIATFTQEITTGFTKATAVITEKSKEVYQASLNIFKEIIETIATGGTKLKEFFEGIWKKIVDWFLKNKELLISAYDKAVLEGWKTLAKYFKTEKIVKATNGVEILCVSFHKALVPVDKILMYARGKVRGVEDLAILQKELTELKKLKQTARKVFDKNPANAKRIDKLKTDIKNIIKSLNNKEGLEKIGILDDVVGNKKLFDFVLAFMNKNAKKIQPRVEYFEKFVGPEGKTTIYMTFSKLPNGKIYLNTIHIF